MFFYSLMNVCENHKMQPQWAPTTRSGKKRKKLDSVSHANKMEKLWPKGTKSSVPMLFNNKLMVVFPERCDLNQRVGLSPFKMRRFSEEVSILPAVDGSSGDRMNSKNCDSASCEQYFISLHIMIDSAFHTYLYKINSYLTSLNSSSQLQHFLCSPRRFQQEFPNVSATVPTKNKERVTFCSIFQSFDLLLLCFLSRVFCLDSQIKIKFIVIFLGISINRIKRNIVPHQPCSF